MQIDNQLLDNLSSTESLNDERTNPNMRAKTVEYLRMTIVLLKKALNGCDSILSKYMYECDIEEFKNDKILKYLYQCNLLLEGFSIKYPLIPKDKNFGFKRLS